MRFSIGGLSGTAYERRQAHSHAESPSTWEGKYGKEIEMLYIQCFGEYQTLRCRIHTMNENDEPSVVYPKHHKKRKKRRVATHSKPNPKL